MSVPECTHMRVQVNEQLTQPMTTSPILQALLIEGGGTPEEAARFPARETGAGLSRRVRRSPVPAAADTDVGRYVGLGYVCAWTGIVSP